MLDRETTQKFLDSLRWELLTATGGYRTLVQSVIHQTEQYQAVREERARDRQQAATR